MSEAIFSPNREYRYTLWRKVPVTFNFEERKWTGNYVMFIGLNPSTADEVVNDPTIRRCISFSSSWGFTRMCMTNLFAYRATQPEDMKKQVDPIGPDNDTHLLQIAAGAGLIIAAWGNHGSFLGRDNEVVKLIPNLHCLGVSKGGHPKHPLYLKGDTQPIAFSSAATVCG